MSAVLPQAAWSPCVPQPLLQGHQRIAGLWFPADWFEPRARNLHLLAAWRGGASALRFPQGDVLRYAQVFEADCAGLSGWPLCAGPGGALASAPLDEARCGPLPPAVLHLVLGAEVISLRAEDAQPLDLAAWLAVDGYPLLDTYSQNPIAAELVQLTPEPAADVRAIFGAALPPASAQRQALLEALRSPTPGGHMREGGLSSLAGLLPALTDFGWRSSAQQLLSRGGRVLLWLSLTLMVLALIGALADGGRSAGAGISGIVFLIVMLARALGLFGRSAMRATAAKARSQPAAKTIKQRDPPPPGASPWRRWMYRLAITSHLARLLGSRQAAYLRRMLELFESGELDEALRHAIPIDGKDAGTGPSFGTPQARDALALSSGRQRSLGIALGSELQTYLRKLYRQSFERLDRENRIDEAVFVLAELLEVRQEALDYLERKQRFAQAAELALLWDLPADTIVRLHCLAGDWRTALAVARRDSAFRSSVLQLEGKFPEAARRLRLEWAHTLATQGDWLGAVDAIWPLADEREQAVEWLDRAEASGGTLGARALVQRLLIQPEAFQQRAEQLAALRDEPARAAQRGAVAAALLAQDRRKPVAGHMRLARLILGAVLADHAEGHGSLNRRDLEMFLGAGDAFLHSDLPPGGLPRTPAGGWTAAEQPRQWSAPEPGSLAILDAVALEDGRALLALGEAGAVVVDREGRTLRRYAVPAQRIVIAASRQVALLLARRDRLWRASRVDLLNHQVGDLGMAELDQFATNFDGIAWTIARRAAVLVLDTQRSLSEVLWHVSDLPGPVLGLSSSATLEQWLVGSADPRDEPTLWTYTLPQRRLKGRDSWSPGAEPDLTAVLLPRGGIVEAWSAEAQERQPRLARLRIGKRSLAVPHPQPDTARPAQPLRLHAGEGWIMLAERLAPQRWQLVSLDSARVHAVIDWPQAPDLGVRACGTEWLMFDGQGRLMRFDVESGTCKGIALR